MKILLIGEYSRLHNSLKEGLQKLGNEVVILGFKDGFKDFPSDFRLEKKWDSGLLKKIRLAVLRLSGFDISSYLTYRQFWKNKEAFRDFDVVQLINENSFYCDLHYEKKILTYIFSHNKKVFLLSCGDDYTNVDYHFKHPENASVLQPYWAGKIKDKNFLGILKFRTVAFKKLHEFIFQNIKGVIASDIDYHIPLENHPKYLGLIPNPININQIPEKAANIEDKIILFLGINRESYYKKGLDFFEAALVSIQQKYPDKTETILTENVPYKEYIHSYNRAHIVLDQCYAKDQGYNALEAMAKGKVVFTGAGKEFVEHYKLQEDKVALNAKPEVDYLVEKLSFLIENPEKIQVIGKSARAFVEKEHHYITVSRKYLAVWNTV